jgi:hypothetical protein
MDVVVSKANAQGKANLRFIVVIPLASRIGRLQTTRIADCGTAKVFP